MSSKDHVQPRSARLARHARRAFDSAQPAIADWVKGGAALGVARTGAKVALTVAKRNPMVFVAAGVLGAGVLAYRFYRKRNPRPLADAQHADERDEGTTTAPRRGAIEGSGEVVARRQPAARRAPAD